MFEQSSDNYCYVDQQADYKLKVLSMRDRAALKTKWLKERINTVLPQIMNREGFDMWLILAREYNEDPVMMTMLPGLMPTARRTTMIVIYKRPDGTIEPMCLVRPGTGLDELYTNMWTNPKGSSWAGRTNHFDATKGGAYVPEEPETQWECLARVIRDRDPKSIGINVSEINAFADGLTKNLYDELYACLDDTYRARLKNAEKLCIGWLETRTQVELDAYEGIMQIMHSIIREAFSNRCVHPGITTADDVAWYMVERVNALGLEHWFPFEVSIRREGVEGMLEGDTIIRPGDILHCDVGLKYLGLCTDTQENAYVLKMGETDAPEGIKNLIAVGNKVQDVFASNFVEGRSGNEILKASLEQCKEQGLDTAIYTHPIGNHGHAAGPTIGLYDQQGGVPGNGDFLLYNNTCYSMELCISDNVPEWGNQRVTLGSETDVAFTQDKVYYIGGRQTSIYLIK